MAPIYAAFACLCICLYVQAPAEGALTKITSLKRIEKGNNFTFIAEYEGDSKVEALWDHTGTAEQTLEPGRATLTTQKVGGWKQRVTLRLGNVHSQYARIDWNVRGNGTHTFDDMDYAMSTVTPGTDLAYVPGNTSIVYVDVPMNRGSGLLRYDYFDVDEVGRYLDPKTNQVRFTETPSFIAHVTERVRDDAVTALTFHSDDFIDGWFHAMLEGDPKDRTNTPIRYITELLVFSVHQADKPHPSTPFGRIH